MPRHKYSTSIELLSLIFKSDRGFEFSDYLRELDSKKNRYRYLKLASRLEKDGIIQKVRDKRGILLKITSKGGELLKKSTSHKLPSFDYTTDKSDIASAPIIVAFDIPEKLRYKRDWLRKALSFIGLKMVQKSLWIGKVKIPEQFLKDLRYLGLENCVEIFAVSKSGSLRDLL